MERLRYVSGQAVENAEVRVSSKSDRLKKLEVELRDLEQWLKLGLVPKKEIAKHEREIEAIRQKIRDEEEKIQFLKESGDVEEYSAPRRPAGRTQYSEGPTLPDIDIGEEQSSSDSNSGTDVDTLYGATATTTVFERGEEDGEKEEEEEDPFSDRNRWRRGMLHSEDEEW